MVRLYGLSVARTDHHTLVERLVELHQRGADRGGRHAHGGEPRALRRHAAVREVSAASAGRGRCPCGMKSPQRAGELGERA